MIIWALKSRRERQKSQVGEIRQNGKSERFETWELDPPVLLGLMMKRVTSQRMQAAFRNWEWPWLKPSKETEASVLQLHGTEFSQQHDKPRNRLSSTQPCRHLDFSPLRLVLDKSANLQSFEIIISIVVVCYGNNRKQIQWGTRHTEKWLERYEKDREGGREMQEGGDMGIYVYV